MYSVCDPTSLTVALFQEKFQQSSSCSVHETVCLGWYSVYSNPEEVGSNGSEGVDLPVRLRESKQTELVLYVHCSQKMWP